MPTAREFIAAAHTFLGYRYSTGPTRTTGADGYLDCSGLIVAAARVIGLTKVPTTSASQASACRDAGKLLPLSTVGRTPGALLFRGPNHGYWGFGPLGHVAIDLGDGMRTIEARGKAYGVVIGPISGRGWTNYAMLPGLAYTTTPGPVPPPKGVTVQFVPPLQFVSWCHFTHPTLGQCTAALAPDGGVFCLPDNAYLGGVNTGKTKADFGNRTPARIEPASLPEDHAAGYAYVVIATDGHRNGLPET